MTQAEKRQIRIAVAAQSQPDGTYRLTSDFGVAPEVVKSIEDALEVINAWAKIRLAKDDAAGAEIVVDLSYPDQRKQERGSEDSTIEMVRHVLLVLVSTTMIVVLAQGYDRRWVQEHALVVLIGALLVSAGIDIFVRPLIKRILGDM